MQEPAVLPKSGTGQRGRFNTFPDLLYSVRRYFDKNTLSFAIPYKLFKKMEDNVEGSFPEKKDWLELLARN